MKNKEKGTIQSNCRPITCLPTTFKLMTAIIAESMINHLENNGLIPDEQKGHRRKSRGTKDQRYGMSKDEKQIYMSLG